MAEQGRLAMTDVFIRSLPITNTPESLIREGFRLSTINRWNLSGANIRALWNMPIRAARLHAEKMATTDPYIFTDDDVLPFGKDWIAHGTRILLAHPEYALASTQSVIKEEMLNLSHAQEEADIFEARCVGAPLWVRKGILGDDLPDFPFRDECVALDAYVLKKGFKSGIINGIRHHHLGFGCATDPTLVRCW